MPEQVQNWTTVAYLVGVPILLGIIGHFGVFRILRKIAQRSGSIIDDSLVKRCYRPLQWTIVVFVIRLILPPTLTDEAKTNVNHILGLLFIVMVSWLLIKTVYVLEDYVVSRFEIGVKDNLRARKIHTQLKVLKRIVISWWVS